LRMTVTDAQGRVLFDSQGVPVGTDHSKWRDVQLTLQGQYGARTSPDVIGNERSSVMYVAAPIRSQDRIVGVVSIGKPVQSFGQFVEAARNKTLLVGLYSVVALGYERLRSRRRATARVGWAGKEGTTFSDAITTVRRWLWSDWVFAHHGQREAFSKLPRGLRETLFSALAPAA